MNKLVQALNEVAEKSANLKEQGICFVCELPAKPRIQTEAGRKEFQISGCCEVCFDYMFKEE